MVRNNIAAIITWIQ